MSDKGNFQESKNDLSLYKKLISYYLFFNELTKRVKADNNFFTVLPLMSVSA